MTLYKIRHLMKGTMIELKLLLVMDEELHDYGTHKLKKLGEIIAKRLMPKASVVAVLHQPICRK